MSRTGKLDLVCTLCNRLLAADKISAPFGDERFDVHATVHTPFPRCGSDGGGMDGFTQAEYKKNLSFGSNEVVATKCGHMFHYGCLRTHVHKSIDNGKERNVTGSLFCPICTKPFAMNRLWKVNIPATKTQREKYRQFCVMKTQNAEMHHQLQGLRSKIADSERELRKIKEDSEECLNDIQAKQKLLDSITGPSNKEMAELTKLHMKRQEILHVVTQHNADLLKLLAEESNLNATTKVETNVPDYNQNYIPELEPTPNVDTFPQPHQHHHQQWNTMESPRDPPPAKKNLRKSKKKTSKKSRRQVDTSVSRNNLSGRSPKPYIQFDPTIGRTPTIPPPSEIMSMLNAQVAKNGYGKSRFPVLIPKTGKRPVDTFAKWENESAFEPLNESSNSIVQPSDSRIDSPPTPFHNKGNPVTHHKTERRHHHHADDKNDEPYPPKSKPHRRDKGGAVPVCITDHEDAKKNHNLQDSVNVLLARKPAMAKEKRVKNAPGAGGEMDIR